MADLISFTKEFIKADKEHIYIREISDVKIHITEILDRNKNFQEQIDHIEKEIQMNMDILKNLTPEAEAKIGPQVEKPEEYENIAAKIGRIRKALDENLDKKESNPEEIEKTYKDHVDDFLEAKKNGTAITA